MEIFRNMDSRKHDLLGQAVCGLCVALQTTHSLNFGFHKQF